MVTVFQIYVNTLSLCDIKYVYYNSSLFYYIMEMKMDT